MEKKYASLAEASAVWLCFDKLEEADWSGRLYTRYKAEPAGFDSIKKLLDLLEQFYDRIGYPQAAVQGRSFREGEHGRKDPAAGCQKGQKARRVEVMEREEMEKLHGEKATFIVRIQYRQNATWQGQVTWAEENKTMNFRSALELIRLIDSTAEVKKAAADGE